MPIDFPSSPTTGDVYTYLGKSWVYNGTGWDVPRALSEIGAVQTFANATARTAAIPSPTEGIVTYLNDVDILSIYESGAWRTSLSPRGGIVQVIQGERTGVVQSTSGTLADTLLTATITPKSASNKILVIVSQPYALISLSNNSQGVFALFRGATNLQATTVQATAGLGSGSLLVVASTLSMVRLDSPATTSATTYKTQFRFISGTRLEAQYDNAPSTITLVEVSA
jgi:hypothetical protein